MKNEDDNSSYHAWLATGLGLTAVMLLGRLSGFVRELSIATLFGADRTADQLIVLLTLPDVLTGLLTAGAMSYVLVPEFRRSDPERARNLFLQASIWSGVALGVVVISIALVAPRTVLSWLAPGFTAADLTSMLPALPLFLALAPLTILAGVATAWLQSHERFLRPAFGTLILNVTIIAGLFIAVQSGSPFLSVGCAVVLGGLLRYGNQIFGLKSQLRDTAKRQPVITRDLLTRYGTALLAGGLFLLFPVVARAFASGMEGDIAVFNYAIKLSDLPLGIAITVLPLMLLPRITEALDGEDPTQAKAMSHATLYATLAISLSIALPAAWFASSVVTLLYGWTSIASDDLAQIAELATIAFLTIPLQGAVAHCMSVMNAANRQGTVLIVSGAALAVFLVLAWWLHPLFGLQGVMLALAIGYALGWLLFATFGTLRLTWTFREFGLSASTAMLTSGAFVVAAVFATLSRTLPTSIILDVVVGSLWCAASLGLALLYYRRWGSAS